MKNYTCSSCGFSMNARNQPGSCPACGHVDKSLRKKEPTKEDSKIRFKNGSMIDVGKINPKALFSGFIGRWTGSAPLCDACSCAPCQMRTPECRGVGRSKEDPNVQA